MKEGRKGTIRATVFPSCRWKLNFSVNLSWPGRQEATQRCPGDDLMESSDKNNTEQGGVWRERGMGRLFSVVDGNLLQDKIGRRTV